MVGGWHTAQLNISHSFIVTLAGLVYERRNYLGLYRLLHYYDNINHNMYMIGV